MSPTVPKVLLFDIGGVCVVSPFQAILDYEIARGIPPGYINYCISRNSPDGFWHKAERGEIPLDDAFFAGFKADLSQPWIWKEYNIRKSQKEQNSQGEPESMNAAIPPLPDIDAEWLFWEMMSKSRAADPWMYPALKRLKASGKFVLAALSNTIIFPSDHPFSRVEENDVRKIFDLFMSSAHIGMRKPDPKIYQYALEKIRELVREKGIADNLGPENIVFLDDIGENLKWAQKAGMRTIRVHLGKTEKAVEELEQITQMSLLDPKSLQDQKARL
ncbi:MAG: hypothetical protein Q9227_001499 [Pyrenula ochraceoflavens]